MNEQTMTITNIQVYPLLEPAGKTKAMARVILDDQLQLTGLRVVQGSNGLFLAYPNDPGYRGEDYRSLFYPVTKALREYIESEVLIKYRQIVEDENASQSTVLLAAQESGVLKGIRGGKDFLNMLSKYNSITDAEESISREIEESVKATALLKTKLKVLKNSKVLPRMISAVHKAYDNKFARLLDSQDKSEKTIARGLSKGAI